MMVVIAVGSMAAPIVTAAKAAGAADTFFAFLDAPGTIQYGVREPEVSATQDLLIQSVNFAYPARPEVKVLNDLNLHIPAGKVTAIVGASGSGKSTIVGLIERWYELDPMTSMAFGGVFSGTIMTGGRNLYEMDLKWWRSQIGLVQQEPFLFNDTIFRNVEYGLVGSQWEFAHHLTKKVMVEQACKEAYADEFITRLPKVCGTHECFHN
jgi:ABC-type multidrug transport system fused ATPase/permease subunit